MEVDRSAFPAPDRLARHLCGVRINVEGQAKLKLGLVDFVQGDEDTGPAHIEMDTFDLRVDPREIEYETVTFQVRGHTRTFKIPFRWQKSAKTGKKIKEELNDWDLDPILPTIAYEDIVAVGVLMLRRNIDGI